MSQSQKLFNYCRVSKQSLFSERIKLIAWKQSWEKCVSLGCRRNCGLCEGCTKSVVALSIIKSVSRGNTCVFFVVNSECPACYCNGAEHCVFSRIHRRLSQMAWCIAVGFKLRTNIEFLVAEKSSVANIHKGLKKHKTSSIYDSTYAWRDNVLTLKTYTGTYRNKWWDIFSQMVFYFFYLNPICKAMFYGS
jgi:hypothetical protein